MRQKSRMIAKTEKVQSRNKLGDISRIGMAFAGVLVIAAAVAAYHAFAAPASTARAPSSVITLSLSPASGKVPKGKNLVISIDENSLGNPVNAVQANLSYSAGKFKFVKIDPTGSAFGVPAESSGSNGRIRIARGSFQDWTGNQLVAKIVLTATGSSGSTQVNFASGSGIIRVTDYKNILQKTAGGAYTLTK